MCDFKNFSGEITPHSAPKGRPLHGRRRTGKGRRTVREWKPGPLTPTLCIYDARPNFCLKVNEHAASYVYCCTGINDKRTKNYKNPQIDWRFKCLKSKAVETGNEIGRQNAQETKSLFSRKQTTRV